MPIKAQYDSLDAVPEALREHYTERGGRFVLAIDGAQLDEDVAGLRASKATILAEKKALEAKLGKIPSDFDPERWAAMQREAEERKQAEIEKKGEFDAAKAALKAAKDAEVGAERERAERYRIVLQKREVDSAAARHLAGKLVSEEDLELLMLRLRQDAAFEEQSDGSFAERYRDDRGEIRMGKSGEPMDTKEYVESVLRTRYPRSFLGTQARGSGAAGSTSTAGGGLRIDTSKLTPGEKLRQGLRLASTAK